MAMACKIASVNGVPLHDSNETPDSETLRQRACTELLRQAAQRVGLLADDDVSNADGSTSEAATAAIEHLLQSVLPQVEPNAADCERHLAANRSRYVVGERLQLRHVLFMVAPGIDVNALRDRAERLLVELRCAEPGSDAFATAAAQWSNCPSGAAGGDLGWLTRADCAPEFAAEVFTHEGIGVLPRLVKTRFGFHIVEVRAREVGQVPSLDSLRPAIVQSLRQHAWITALRRYLDALGADAEIEGVSLAQ